ncbi:MAG TPA: glutamate-cysteine ligase family protein [Polyangiaceae bacterium]|nr:glutamate-cysteine ligase family protein [Polyangiaceae bacterium]
MGIEIDREEFEDADYERFSGRLRDDLCALERLLARPAFGQGPKSMGAEVELNLVDPDGSPRPVNRAVLAESLDPRVTLEINRFNLELNSRPVLFSGAPFSAFARELGEALTTLSMAAAQHGARVVTVGILPTLTEADFGAATMSDFIRYRALSKSLRRLRGEPFTVHIEGPERLVVQLDDVTFEGAATSFQLHLRVAPEEFASAFNAAQVATAPALAVSANSPFFLGRRLWAETRVALFRQAVDHRPTPLIDDWRPARVSFGHGWVRKGPHELFAESVALYPPLLPIIGAEDPLACVQEGGVPTLAELRLHQGTVWSWNRPVYDAAEGGHVRLELRALPAGPTVADMAANAAFLLGLTLGLMPDVDRLLPALTFGHARRNFYQAACHGLDAELLWPDTEGVGAKTWAARELVVELIPLAWRGLASVGVAEDETARWLGIIEERLRRELTGARWQERTVGVLERTRDRKSALRGMLERYIRNAISGEPVHTWSL